MFSRLFIVLPDPGLEPGHPHGRGILNPLRLPFRQSGNRAISIRLKKVVPSGVPGLVLPFRIRLFFVKNGAELGQHQGGGTIRYCDHSFRRIVMIIVYIMGWKWQASPHTFQLKQGA